MLGVEAKLNQRRLERLFRIIVNQAKDELVWLSCMHYEVFEQLCILCDLSYKVLFLVSY